MLYKAEISYKYSCNVNLDSIPTTSKIFEIRFLDLYTILLFHSLFTYYNKV